MKFKTSTIIYSLTVEDAQSVAEQEIDRELTFEEIQKVKDLVEEKINWYDTLSEAIDQIVR